MTPSKDNRVTPKARTLATILAATFLSIGFAHADGPSDPKAVASEDGKYTDADGLPTFKVDAKGKVDFYTYVGFVRYSANCLRCHGPDGTGSTYAPALIDSLQTLTYGEFLATVVAGKQNVSASENLVMPALGEDKNVMCYIDPIYVYLRARSFGAVGRGRPEDHEPKPATFTAAENGCMG